MGAGKLTLGKVPVRVVEGVDAKGRRAVHIFDGGYLQTAQIKPNTDRSPGPMGNTIGKIVPKTDPFGLKGLWDKWGEAVHLGLDVIGLIPGLGEVADGLNAAIYLAEGDVVNAALSAAAMIPIGGQVATAAKLAKKGVDAVQAAGKQAAKKASKEAVEQTGKKAGKQPPANGGKKGGNGKKKKPHKDCGKLSKYSQAPAGRGAAGLEADHIPSGAAWEKALENKLREMHKLNDISKSAFKSIAKSIKNQAPTITIPKDVHMEGDTWGKKNTPKMSSDDAKDLKGAARRNTDAIQKSMGTKDHGCSKAYAKAAKELIETTDFDKIISDGIARGMKRFGIE